MFSDTTDTVLICKPGFANRLSGIMDEIGFPVRGRVPAISKWTGLSNTAVRNLLKQDRLPRAQEHFELIVHNLCEYTGQAGIETTVKEMEAFLLGKSSIDAPGRRAEELVAKTSSESLSSIEKGQLHVALHECGATLGVNVFTDLDRISFDALFEKAAKIKSTLDCSCDSKEMREIIKALIKSSI